MDLDQSQMCTDQDRVIIVPQAQRALRFPRPNALGCLIIISLAYLQLNASTFLSGEADALKQPVPLSWDNELLRIHHAGQPGGVLAKQQRALEKMRRTSKTDKLEQALNTAQPLKIEHSKAWIARPVQKNGKTIGVRFDFASHRRIEHQLLSARVVERRIRRARHGKRVHKIELPERVGKQTLVPLQKMLYRNINRIKMCYENGLKSNPSLAGKIEVRMRIARKTGVIKVKSVKLISNTLGRRGDKITRCMTQRMLGMSIKHKGKDRTFEIQQTFAFTSK